MSKYNILTTDVLVVGGGCSGLAAALMAREQGVEVLVADKADIGFAGQPSRAGNGILAIPEQMDPEAYVGFATMLGRGLTDEDNLRAWTIANPKVIKKLVEWGVGVPTKEDGSFDYMEVPGLPCKGLGIELNMTNSMKKQALRSGVKLLSRTEITGLIKNGNTVVGAVGFDTITGEPKVFHAKAVILATAGCAFRVVRMFNGRGTGMRLAFEAGAQMRNAEFGNFFEVLSVATAGSLYGTHAFIYNQKGENLNTKYAPPMAPDVTPELVLGIEKEELEGNGPCYIDMVEKAKDETWKVVSGDGTDKIQGGTLRFYPDKMSWMAREMQREGEFMHIGDKPEIRIGIHGNMGAVRVNDKMETTVPGLYCVGVESFNGSGVMGAMPNPTMRGNGLGHALPTGYIGGVAAAEYAKAGELKALPEDEIDRLVNEYKALYKDEGEDAEAMILEMHGVVDKSCYMIRRSEDRLKEGISKLDDLLKRADNIKAVDAHGASKAFEVKCMLMAGKLSLVSALERKDSRGYHFREDYPMPDFSNWQKWVLVDNVNGEMVTSTEDIPSDRYIHKFTPPPFVG